MKTLIQAVLLGVMAVLPRTAAPEEAEIMERLRAGEILLEDARTDESGGSARVRLLIRAPAEALWGVFMSCEHAFFFVDGLERCEVLHESADYVQTRQVVDKGWLVPELDYVFETRRTPYTRMDFKLLEGNLRTMEGFWRLKPVPEGVIVTHEIRIRPLMPAPRWLVRRTIKKDMPGLMACIRGLTERSVAVPGDAGAGRDDLERCAQDPTSRAVHPDAPGEVVR